ncbi:MAG: Rieske 2Fe-2S domain-containing protein [Candidatus Vesicomyosocius endoextente]|uniref:Rieske 2Fe-2S domain-containing protein n=1 Tax=Candidatus Vesicomyosocius endoextente TaxID=2738853 RepID=A0A853G8P5_9GAMM|nr:Rieske 2Fe-2S domain-containing protein [Candidatus Vesicomyosocius endoextente]
MWVKILDKEPKEGEMVEVVVEGKDLFVTLNQGKLYCADNRCPHEDIKLTLGCLKDNRIKCSLHGFSFDLITGNSTHKSVDNLRIYSIKQENNKIYLKL